MYIKWVTFFCLYVNFCNATSDFLINFSRTVSRRNFSAYQLISLEENLLRPLSMSSSSRAYCSISSRKDAGLKNSELIKCFDRVLTLSGHNLLPVSIENHHSFMYSHWLKYWADEWVNKEEGKGVNSKENRTEHRKLHEELYKHLLREKDTALSPQSVLKHSIPSVKIYKDLNEIDKKEDAKLQHPYETDPFPKGHCLTLHGKTNFPKSFVALYAKNEYEEKGRKAKEALFLLPLEQALFYRTVEDYFYHVSILKIWSAYCQFALVVIPPNTLIYAKMGLVAPQTFPYLLRREFWKQKGRKLFGYDNYDIARTRKEILKLSEEGRAQEILDQEKSSSRNLFYDKVAGGATQFQLFAADDYELYDLEGVINPPPLNYYKSYKINHNNKIYWGGNYHKIKNMSSDKLMMSHFLDKEYYKRQLDFPQGLKNLGLINQAEYEDIHEIIKRATAGLYKKD